MKKLFIVIICSVSNLLIIFSCSTKNDCKKLIVHTWQTQDVEFVDETKFREDFKEGLKKSLQKQGIDPESYKGLQVLSQIDDLILQAKNQTVEFTVEGKILGKNSEKLGYYKLSRDCEKIFTTYENITKTNQIKHLSNDKLIVSGDGVITTYKSLN